MGFYSDFLIEHLDGLDEYIDEAGSEIDVTPEDRALKKKLEELCRAVVQGKGDWFLPVDTAVQTRAKLLEDLSDKFVIFFERIILRRLLQQADGMVTRLLESPAILLAKQPPEDVRTYLVEATRCYTYGLFQACTILCRAGLHAALLDRLDARGERVFPPRRDEFAGVIAFAGERRILREEDRVRADRVRSTGGRAAHGEKVTQAHARSALVGLRQLVARLYA